MKNYAYTKARAMYDSLSIPVKDVDTYEALKWAHDTLRDHEGGGHSFYIHAEGKNQYRTSFAKPSWSGDHCSEIYGSCEESIIMSVCEYLSGC